MDGHAHKYYASWLRVQGGYEGRYAVVLPLVIRIVRRGAQNSDGFMVLTEQSWLGQLLLSKSYSIRWFLRKEEDTQYGSVMGRRKTTIFFQTDPVLVYVLHATYVSCPVASDLPCRGK